MGNYALIKDGKVINKIVWDGQEESPMTFGKGVTAVEIKDGDVVDMGYEYKDGKFIVPPLTEEQEEAIRESLRLGNINTKQSLINEATQHIGIYQDAVDLDIATDKEAAMLPLWKKFRIMVNRIDADTYDDIAWPEKPE